MKRKAIPIRTTKNDAIAKPVVGFIFLVTLNKTANVKRSPIMNPVPKNAVAYPLYDFLT